VFSFRELPQNAPAVEEPPKNAEEAEDIAVISREMVQSPEDKEVVEVERRVVVVPKCPDCGGETKVSSTRKAFRWHKCVRCGKTLKTAR
jgi:ribosomal protein L34E